MLRQPDKFASVTSKLHWNEPEFGTTLQWQVVMLLGHHRYETKIQTSSKVNTLAHSRPRHPLSAEQRHATQ